MAGSPRRIFRSYTNAELLELRTSLMERMRDGAMTALSGAQKSASFEFANMEDQMFELDYELRARGIAPSGATVGPNVVYQNFATHSNEAQQ